MIGQALKQLKLPSGSLIVGDTTNRASEFPPGADGQILGVSPVTGKPAWQDQVVILAFKRFSFEELGPTVPATDTWTLDTTLPISLQDGTKTLMVVSINGLVLPPSVYMLTGDGPYSVVLDMGLIGYSLDNGDVVTVSYNTVTDVV